MGSATGQGTLPDSFSDSEFIDELYTRAFLGYDPQNGPEPLLTYGGVAHTKADLLSMIAAGASRATIALLVSDSEEYGVETHLGLENLFDYFYTQNFDWVTIPDYCPAEEALVDGYSRDCDEDQLPDWWEIMYFGDLESQRGSEFGGGIGESWDADSDGVSNFDAYAGAESPCADTCIEIDPEIYDKHDGAAVPAGSGQFQGQPLVHSTEVGVLKGKFSVNRSGAASYAIPIELPPGINGLQPNLSFRYSSQAGNGDMGVGWNFSGGSAIARCGTNFEMDDVIKGVTFDDTDRFCLEGQRLVLTDGTYGAINSEYRVAINGFEKIVALGAQGNGPRYFKVFRSNGDVSFYGNDDGGDDSLHWQTSGTGEVYAWYLNKHADHFGNEINYEYLNLSAGGALILDSIAYSDYVVKPNWNTGRTDIRFGYIAQDTAKLINYRLESLDWKVGDNVVGSYEIDYEYVAGKSVISNIAKCMNGQCFDPSYFETVGGDQNVGPEVIGYTSQLSDVYFSGKLDNADDIHDMGTRIIDINGDGYDDLIQLYLPESDSTGLRNVYLSDGSEFIFSPEYTDSLQGEDIYFSSSINNMGTRIADLNGDGLPDLLQSYQAEDGGHYEGDSVQRVYINKGDEIGFEFDLAYSDSVVAMGDVFNTLYYDQGFRIVDLNGDGLSDIIRMTSFESLINNNVWINDGVQFTVDEEFAATLPDHAIFVEHYSNTDRGTRIVDINGDGLVDIITLHQVPPEDIKQVVHRVNEAQYGREEFSEQTVYLNNGEGFDSADPSYTINLPEDLSFSYTGGYYEDLVNYAKVSEPSLDMGTRLADINGDGLVDLIQMHLPDSLNGDLPLQRVYLNNGLSFEYDTDYSDSLGHSDLSETFFTHVEPTNGEFGVYYHGGRDMGTRITDVNGDGLFDLMQLYLPPNSSVGESRVFINNGKGFDYDSEFTSVNSNNAYFTDSEARDMGVRLGDVDGDGAQDIIQLYRSPAFHYSEIPEKRVFLTNRLSHNVNRITKSELVGGDIFINYDGLLESYHYDVNQASVYPEIVYQGSLQVVTSVQKEDGLGGTNTTGYNYEDLKFQVRGMGNLGFRKITRTTPFGFTNATVYSQDWQNRTIGMVEQQWSIAPNSGVVLSSKVNELESEIINYVGSDAYFPRVRYSTMLKRDLNGAFLSSKSTGNEYNDDQQIENVYSCASEYDPTVSEWEVLALALPCDSVTAVGAFKERRQFEYYDNSLWPDYLPKLKLRKTFSWLSTSEEPYPMADGALQEIQFDYHWDQGGLLKAETIEPNQLELQLKTEYVYYSSGLKDTVTVSGYDMESDVSKYSYNANGTLKSLVEGHGIQNLTTHYYYDDIRFPWLVTATQDANTPSGFSGQVEYDSFGRLEVTIDKLGVNRTILQSWCIDTWACSDIDGSSYIKTTVVPGESYKHVVFDRLGREKYRTTFGYSDELASAKLQTVDYNARAWVEFSSIPYYFSEKGIYQDYGLTSEYDELGRVVGTVDQSGRTTSSLFDGREATYTNAKGQTKKVTQNVLGQKTEVIDHDLNATEYLYGPLGNLVMVKANGSSLNDTKIGYNVRGFKTEMTDPDTGRSNYTYDGIGRIRTETDNKGQVSETNYDNLGRVTTQVDDRDGSAVTNLWTYVNSGQHIGKLDSVSGNGLTESYRYDAYSRLNETVTTVDNTSYTSTQNYDVLGRLKFLDYPGDALRLKYEYQVDTGILQRVRNDGTNLVYWESTHENAAGQIEGFTLGGQIDVSESHDPDTGFMNSIYAVNVIGVELVGQTYDFDDVGNLTDRYDTVNEVHDHYTYDGLNRLEDNEVNTIGGSAIGVQSLGYDAIGNIHQKSDIENNAVYQYGGAGCSSGNQTCAHAVSQIGSKSFFYDANGNMTNGGGRAIQYTSFNKPSSIVKDGKTTTFSYGPSHSRYKRVDSGGASPNTTYYIQGLMEVVTGSTTKTKLYVGDFAVLTQESGQSDETRYLLQDQLGSVIAIVDELGQAQEKYNYDAWGKRRYVDGDFMDESEFFSFASLMITNTGYTGHEHLDDVGLIHMNGRVYDPLTARFLSADPIVQDPMNMQSLNRYSYVWNNPLSYTDPTGYMSESNYAETNQSYIPDVYYDNGGLTVVVEVSIGGNNFSFGSSGMVAFSPGGFVPEDLVAGDGSGSANVVGSGSDLGNDNVNLVNFGINSDLPCAVESDSCIAEEREERVDSVGDVALDWAETAWSVFEYVSAPYAGAGGMVNGTGRAASTIFRKLFPRGGAKVTKTAGQIGRAGEDAVRAAYNIGKKQKFGINGRNRIPDGVTSTTLSEVKNVKSLSYTSQLRDFADIAKQQGLKYDLYVRPSTSLSGPLSQAIENGVINLKFIPGAL